jgi:hypothetical protein
MLYITDIQTNIKFPGSVCLSGLSPHIFISGGNATGKTALMNAVELALTGEVRDIGGREKAKSGAILEGLMHPSESSLFAVVKLSNGHTASWVMERGKRPVHQPLPGNVHFLLPEIMGMLKGSKAVVARFLVKHFGHNAEVPSVDYGSFGESFAHEKLSATQLLIKVEEASRKAAASHTAEARALKTALKKLGAPSAKAAHAHEKVTLLGNIVALLSFQIEKELDRCGVCGEQADMNTLGGRLARAQGQLDQLGGLHASERVNTLQEALESAEKQATACKAISDDCMGAMYQMVEEGGPRICLEITECLPAEFPLCVGLKINKSSLPVGFYNPDDEHLHPHVSGAELITLCTAIGGAIAKRLPPNDLAVLTTPDRALDLEYLRRLLAMMKQIPAVTLIQSPFQPRGRPSVNWTRIILEDDGSLTVHGENTEGYSASAG